MGCRVGVQPPGAAPPLYHARRASSCPGPHKRSYLGRTAARPSKALAGPRRPSQALQEGPPRHFTPAIAGPRRPCPPRTARPCARFCGPVPASSARSGRHMPHRSPGSKHPLTNASPSLKRTRTASCTFHSGGASQGSWPPALSGGRHRGGSPTWSGPTTHEASSNATTYP